MVILNMRGRLGVLVAAALPAVLSTACVVPDPGPGDTLPAAPPALPPPITVNYRHPDVNPITDPSLYPDSELIDLHVPQAVGPQTGLLLWVHGGGWTMGDRTGIPAWVLQQVPRGYLVASIGYRLAFYDANGIAQNTFPAAVEDVKLAVRFMKLLGAWLGTSPRLILAGASAGGHLASFVDATRQPTAGAVCVDRGGGGHHRSRRRTNSPSDLAGDDQLPEHNRDERRDCGRAAAASATGAADALSCGTGRQRVLVIDAHPLRRSLRPRCDPRWRVAVADETTTQIVTGFAAHPLGKHALDEQLLGHRARVVAEDAV